MLFLAAAGTSSWSTFRTVGTNLQCHAAEHTSRSVLSLAPRSYSLPGGQLGVHREGRKGLRIPWTWKVLTAAAYHDRHLFPTGGKGHPSPTATCSIVPTSSWLPYWLLLSPGKPVGWPGSASSQYLLQVRIHRLTGSQVGHFPTGYPGTGATAYYIGLGYLVSVLSSHQGVSRW